MVAREIRTVDGTNAPSTHRHPGRFAGRTGWARHRLRASPGNRIWPGRRHGKLALEMPGTGPCRGVLAGSAKEPAQVWFQEHEPALTVCRYAWPVDKDGKYTAAEPWTFSAGPPPPDLWRVVPLPWEEPGPRHLVPGVVLTALGLVLIARFAWKRDWSMTLLLLGCFVFIPLYVGYREVANYNKAPEQEFAWDAWPLLWPYVFYPLVSWNSVTDPLLHLLRSPLLWMGVLVLWLRVWLPRRRRRKALAGGSLKTSYPA
jgi:hypothetical protein